MKSIEELGIAPAPWFARLGVMEGDFVNAGSADNEAGEVCAVSLPDCDLKLSHANARLIAAAPEMYDCLRALWEYNDHGGWGEALEAMVRAVLVKAGGAE